MRSLLLSTVMMSAALGGCEEGDSSAAAPEQEAIAAAETWLALVDSGRYDDSWDNACEFFRTAVPKDQWRTQIRGVRGPLGALQSRTVASSEFKTELPGAPDGEYVIIQYTTSFANKASSTETITPMLEADGTWRVSGYYIR